MTADYRVAFRKTIAVTFDGSLMDAPLQFLHLLDCSHFHFMKRLNAALLLIAGMISACDGGTGAIPDGPGTTPASLKQNSAMPSSAQSPYLTEVKALGEFTDQHGFRRQYVLVAPGLNDRQLIDLAQRLHAVEKDAWLWMLDSDSEAKQMLDALPATERGDLSRYPGKWVEAHTLAHSVLESDGSGRRWVLYKGPYTGTKLAVLRY